MANLTTKRDTSFQNKKLKVVLIKEIPIAHDIYSLTEPPEKLFTRIIDQPNRSISTSLAYLSSLLQDENITSNKNDQQHRSLKTFHRSTFFKTPSTDKVSRMTKIDKFRRTRRSFVNPEKDLSKLMLFDSSVEQAQKYHNRSMDSRLTKNSYKTAHPEYHRRSLMKISTRTKQQMVDQYNKYFETGSTRSKIAQSVIDTTVQFNLRKDNYKPSAQEKMRERQTRLQSIRSKTKTKEMLTHIETKQGTNQENGQQKQSALISLLNKKWVRTGQS